MPLIEGFLAFALTMLALSTAVSAIVGVWLRFFRWRAWGFRRSMETIYDREIEPRLREAQRQIPPGEERLNFLADMTFGLNAAANTVNREVRQLRVSELERCQGRPQSDDWFRKGWERLALRSRRWHSLRYGVDYMTESQFRLRLDASTAGRALATYHSAAEWQQLTDHLTNVFNEVGVSATETFARRARIRTVIAGLLLAIAVNIDSFDLLNTYLTNDEIRNRVIAQQEEILARQTIGTDALPAVDRRLSESGERLGSAIQRVEETIAELGETQKLDSDSRQKLESLQERLNSVSGDIAIMTEAGEELEDAVSKTRGIAASLTRNFPIGWDSYPNCRQGSADIRCARLEVLRKKACDPPDGPGVQQKADGSAGSDSGDVSNCEKVGVVFADTSGFIKWLVGVLITGFMVGLGAPFWVQTVDRLLKLKSHLQPTVSTAPAQQSEAMLADGGSQQISRPPPMAPAGAGGQVARTAADQAAGANVTPASPVSAGSRARRAADEAAASISRSDRKL
jgi:hypothetical protein